MTDQNAAHQRYLHGSGLEETDRGGALKAYQECLNGDCTHLDARINFGRLLHLEGRHNEAEEIYRGTAEPDGTLLFNLAALLEDQGRGEEAIRYYRQSIVHDPTLPDPHLNLSLLLEARGQAQAAYRHLLAYHRLLAAHESPREFDEADHDEDPA